MEELSKVGEFIRERRIELRLRQEDLSEMAGVNMKTIPKQLVGGHFNRIVLQHHSRC